MRNPRRWRNIGLAFLASGIIASIAVFWLPEAAAADTARAVLIGYGLTALLFGGGSALFRHFDARAQDALGRGENILARWRVDAATWRQFLAHDRELNRESGALVNELSIRDEVPDDGIEVIVGSTAVQIDGSLHALPRRGTPEITHAKLNTSRVRPTYIELHLYYPGGGHGASGVTFSATRTALRFPVPSGAQEDAELVVAHYGGDQPGRADFFHGRGDGSDPEDLSTCPSCGYETHQYRSHCPRCGCGIRSKRWARRFGAVLFMCGLFITGVMGVVLYYSAPLLLRPGVSVDGARFSGTAVQGLLFLGILAVVATAGATVMLFGLWQVKTGGTTRD
jgi:hypothetical protein